MSSEPPQLSKELLGNIDAYWRAAVLSVGQIYLYDNPLLKRRLTLAHIKRRLLGLRAVTLTAQQAVVTDTRHVVTLSPRGFDTAFGRPRRRAEPGSRCVHAAAWKGWVVPGPCSGRPSR